jgi:hypothetical protein
MRDSTLTENGAVAEVKTKSPHLKIKPEGASRSIVFENTPLG